MNEQRRRTKSKGKSNKFSKISRRKDNNDIVELGKANRREIAALAGLAPYANDSGKTSKRRRTSAE
jgi:hypothetical protein